MRNNLIFAFFVGRKRMKTVIVLTFGVKNYNILNANAKTFCFKTNQRIEVEEECLKSKMAEKYGLNITMTVCQIKKLHKYIRCWFRISRSFQSLLAFYPYLQIQLKLNLRMVMVMLTLMIILKREVI